MRNRIYLINFPAEIQLSDETLKHYDVIQGHKKVSDFVLSHSQGIIIYTRKVIVEKKEFNYFQEIHYINKEDLKKLLLNPLEIFDNLFGRKKLVNPKQFEIVKGSIVRSKVQASLGPGVVCDVSELGISVKFTKAKEFYSKEVILCHPSTLRVVSHIEEVKNEIA